MNSSLLAGLGVGSGLVLLGFVGSSLLFPPERGPVAQPTTEIASMPGPAPDRSEAEIVVPDSALVEPPQAAPEDTAQDNTAEGAPVSSDTTEIPADLATDPELAEIAPPESTPSESIPPESTPDDEPPAAPLPSPELPQDTASTADLAEDILPVAPGAEVTGPQARLPAGILPATGRDTVQGLPQVSVPQAPASDPEIPVVGEAPATDDRDSAPLVEQPPASLPGTRTSSLPQIGAGDSAPDAPGDVPAPQAAAVTALERNSLYDGSATGARMALVLSDPGLPMAMRRSLAAMDFPFTVALNPLDTTAPDAATIYTEAGKEVLILATAIPDGATASDLDVTFNAFFGSLPLAVGVIDLPQSGFARNARLLNEVLPLLQQDGHGLVTFSGGLAQAARAASAAGVPHAEVFRIIDSGNDSAFTMRRFLDRAVFQASQMGQVIVFGDASNDVLMEAITMWREGSRLDQVALVPISGILRNLP
ncbi:MAG: divergent polysaccharide deacetylase family protein [Natronohydrobacter sp.]|nr:divergent polysaccharide deacetylase family protein [Natronohydrobacter sp.]